jgi:hypothetical protein
MDGSLFSNISYLPVVVAWYASGKTDISNIRSWAHQAGAYTSQRMRKIIPGWDTVMEPMIISQMARIFVGFHSFTQGLTSDNTNVVQTEQMMADADSLISDELSMGAANCTGGY